MKEYERPPFLEALCEIYFMPGDQWDITIPGSIYQEVKNKYPKKEQQARLEISIGPGEDSNSQKVCAVNRMVFRRDDNSGLIQIEPNLLVVNILSPYPTWPNFKASIIESVQTYSSIVKPKSVKSIGLRYLNRFDFSEEVVDLSDFIDFYPRPPKALQSEFGGFNLTMNLPVKDARDIIQLAVSDSQTDRQTKSLVFDLYYRLVEEGSLQLAEIPEWLDKAHNEIETAFELSITEKGRKMFGGVKIG